MLTELQNKWLVALESGDYQQGYRKLHFNGCYCCLGVACEVMGFENKGTYFDCVPRWRCLQKARTVVSW